MALSHDEVTIRGSGNGRGMTWGEVKGGEMWWDGFANETHTQETGTLPCRQPKFLCVCSVGGRVRQGENPTQSASTGKNAQWSLFTWQAARGGRLFMLCSNTQDEDPFVKRWSRLIMCTPHARYKLFNYSIQLIIQLLEILKCMNLVFMYTNVCVCVRVCQCRHPPPTRHTHTHTV